MYFLRCKQINLTLEELKQLPLPFVMDMFIEQGNDNYNYPIKASQADMDAF